MKTKLINCKYEIMQDIKCPYGTDSIIKAVFYIGRIIWKKLFNEVEICDFIIAETETSYINDLESTTAFYPHLIKAAICNTERLSETLKFSTITENIHYDFGGDIGSSVSIILNKGEEDLIAHLTEIQKAHDKSIAAITRLKTFLNISDFMEPHDLPFEARAETYIDKETKE